MTRKMILDRTSFYAEKGGQIGDRGALTLGDVHFDVSDTQYQGEAVVHHGKVASGALRTGDMVHAHVSAEWRREIRRHHTSAHLLQRALKDVLGDEVTQAGSWVGIDRMRFDFRSPGGGLSPEQKRDVARRVNEMIRDDTPLETRVLGIEEARASGAIMMFGEKYGDRVRVVKAGPSVEFCGGTHAHSTGELGMFVILNEFSDGQRHPAHRVVRVAFGGRVHAAPARVGRRSRFGRLRRRRKNSAIASPRCSARSKTCKMRLANSKRAWPPPMRKRTSSARNARARKRLSAQWCTRRTPKRCAI